MWHVQSTGKLVGFWATKWVNWEIPMWKRNDNVVFWEVYTCGNFPGQEPWKKSPLGFTKAQSLRYIAPRSELSSVLLYSQEGCFLVVLSTSELYPTRKTKLRHSVLLSTIRLYTGSIMDIYFYFYGRLDLAAWIITFRSPAPSIFGIVMLPIIGAAFGLFGIFALSSHFHNCLPSLWVAVRISVLVNLC